MLENTDPRICHDGKKKLLTLSSIYSHFNTLKKKSFRKTLWKKGEISQNEQFYLYPQCFVCNLYLYPLIAIFQLSSAASLNLRRSQNGLLGNVLTKAERIVHRIFTFLSRFDKCCHGYVKRPRRTIVQGSYSPTVLENILSLVLQIFLYSEAFECNTPSDWLNRTV